LSLASSKWVSAKTALGVEFHLQLDLKIFGHFDLFMTDGNLKPCDSEPHVKNSNRLLLNKELSHHSKRQDKQALAVYDTGTDKIHLPQEVLTLGQTP
jgi:hypothetical protein